MDSTRFHNSGVPRIEDRFNIVLEQWYRGYNHPELALINELMLCDELSKHLVFENCVSGHLSDKTCLRNVITDYWDSIKAQFKDLRYPTGDIALCISPKAKVANEHGIKMTLRIPDKNDEFSSFREMLEVYPEQQVPVDENNPEGTKAIWCGKGELGDENVKKL